ncbi:hypothetical protein NDU88_005084 [Pleurodeles waltl]|uniref:Uncharacterized protein n=1 Tax=Pleurodeles waltl TaxID=8319 RepID=A0AAV7WU79_PLEWA|nr:hypothetical protein NDU88_005084 [Pleurodeles waltl]
MVVFGLFLEGEVDAVVVGPVEFGGVVPKEDVILGSECVGAGEDGDGVAERCPGSGGSVDERSSEGGVGVGVDSEVQVFGGLEGVVQVGVDFKGGLVDDGYTSPDSVDAIPKGDLVAVRDGYGDVRHRGVVPPGFGQEGYVRGGGVEQVPELDGVLACGAGVEVCAVEVVDSSPGRFRGSVAGEATDAAGEGSVSAFWGGLEAGGASTGVECEEGAGVVT